MRKNLDDERFVLTCSKRPCLPFAIFISMSRGMRQVSFLVTKISLTRKENHKIVQIVQFNIVLTYKSLEECTNTSNTWYINSYHVTNTWLAMWSTRDLITWHQSETYVHLLSSLFDLLSVTKKDNLSEKVNKQALGIQTNNNRCSLFMFW
jgi:hypothetical protein